MEWNHSNIGVEWEWNGIDLNEGAESKAIHKPNKSRKLTFLNLIWWSELGLPLLSIINNSSILNQIKLFYLNWLDGLKLIDEKKASSPGAIPSILHQQIHSISLLFHNWFHSQTVLRGKCFHSIIDQIFSFRKLHSRFSQLFHSIHSLGPQRPSTLFISSFSSLGRAEMKRNEGVEWPAAIIHLITGCSTWFIQN